MSTWYASHDGEDPDVSRSDTEMELDAEPSAPSEAPTDTLVMGGGRTLAGGPAQSSASSSSRPAASAPSRGANAGSRGPRTLKDLQGDSGHGGHGHAHDEDDDEEDQDFFAGGEKSGLAVQNPGAGNSTPRDQINSLLDRARRYVSFHKRGKARGNCFLGWKKGRRLCLRLSLLRLRNPLFSKTRSTQEKCSTCLFLVRHLQFNANVNL